MYTFDKPRPQCRIGTVSFGWGNSPMCAGDRGVERVGCLPGQS